MPSPLACGSLRASLAGPRGPSGGGAAGGWIPGILTHGIAERVDDYCATAFTYCRDPQPVPRLGLAAALADIGRRPYEAPSPLEPALAAV